MAENKKSFLMYCDWQSTFESLTDEEAGQLIKHFFKYVNDENPAADNRLISIVFEPMKAVLKNDLKKWEYRQEQRAEAGRRSAENRKLKSTTVDETQRPLTTVNEIQRPLTNVDDTSISFGVNGNVNGNGNGNVNGNVKEEEYNITTPPTPKGEKTPKLVDKSSLNYKARIMFEDCYKSMFENAYYWTAKDAGQMAQLIKKLSFQIKEKKGGAEISDDEVLSGLDYLLKNISDRWILENYTVTTIATKYNEIIAQIKNGNKKNIRITSEKDEREFIDAVINGVGRAEYERNQRVQWGGG